MFAGELNRNVVVHAHSMGSLICCLLFPLEPLVQVTSL